MRHARQRGFQLGDPAQSRGEELFKSSNLVPSTTDSEKSSQRHEIQTTTENSCAQWPRRLTSKLTKKPVGGWGAWELQLIYHISFNTPIEIHLFFKSDWLFLQLLCKPNLEYAMPVPAQIWEECARHIGKLVTFSSVPLLNLLRLKSKGSVV